MSRSRITREVAIASLGGTDLTAVLLRGLRSYEGLRRSLRALCEGAAPVGRGFVRVRLRNRYTLRLYFASQAACVPHPRLGTDYVLRLQGATITTWLPPLAEETAGRLAAIVGTDVSAASRLALGIDRARHQILALAEARTRWL